MAGLDPAIYASRRQGAPQFQIVNTISKLYGQSRSAQVFLRPRFVDGRDKPGHDVAPSV
jgi:hypothetical protein